MDGLDIVFFHGSSAGLIPDGTVVFEGRGFMFSPVYVSAESMRWWLGRDGFATQKCILATRKEVIEEEKLIHTIEVNHSIKAKERGNKAGEEQTLDARGTATTEEFSHDGVRNVTARTSTSTKISTTREKSALPEADFPGNTIQSTEETNSELKINILQPDESERPKTGTDQDGDGIAHPASLAPPPASSSSSSSRRSSISSVTSSASATPPPLSPEVSIKKPKDRKLKAWFDRKFPPLALWIAGSEKLVDGIKLLQRFKQGRRTGRQASTFTLYT